ncbi:MAG TPA: hypothetical protein VNM92_05065 [Thermoanaerobaculia bacterium]|nr:hypothetical protein [Thermoanaerobaculia bacterium]
MPQVRPDLCDVTRGLDKYSGALGRRESEPLPNQGSIDAGIVLLLPPVSDLLVHR